MLIFIFGLGIQVYGLNTSSAWRWSNLLHKSTLRHQKVTTKSYVGQVNNPALAMDTKAVTGSVSEKRCSKGISIE